MREKQVIKENRLREPSDTSRVITFAMQGSQKEKRKGRANLCGEITAENVKNLGKETNPDPGVTETVQQNQPSRSTPRHMVIKMAKSGDKERILKAAKEEHQIQRKPHKAISGLFSRNSPNQKAVA